MPQVTVDPDKFQMQLENEYLYEAFSQLTVKQKLVIGNADLLIWKAQVLSH